MLRSLLKDHDDLASLNSQLSKKNTFFPFFLSGFKNQVNYDWFTGALLGLGLQKYIDVSAVIE